MNAPLVKAPLISSPRRSNCPTRASDNLRMTDQVVLSPGLLLEFFEAELMAAFRPTECATAAGVRDDC